MIRLFAIATIWFTPLCCPFAQNEWRISELGVSDGLSQGYIYEIYQDKNGFIWIGTHGGLNRYDGYRFKVFQYDPFDAFTLADNAVFFLEEDPETGKFWIGGSSALNEFDPATFSNIRHSYHGKQLEFSDGRFVSNHEILLACQDAVMLFDTRKRTFISIPVHDEHNAIVSVTRAENVSRDRQGNLMVMSRSGIFFYDPSSQTCKRKIPSGPDLAPLNKYEVFDVVQDRNGKYWVATNKDGLVRFDAVSGTLNRVSLPIQSSNRDLRFDEVMEDTKGNIWAGCTNGLIKIDPITLKVDHFSTESNPSLGHNEINVIYEDRNHFMWVGTVGNGINKMIPRNTGFRNYPVVVDKNATGSYIMALEQLGDDVWFMNIWDQVGKINVHTGQYEVVSPELFHGGHRWYSEGTLIKTGEAELSLLNGEFQYIIASEGTGKVTIKSKHSPGLSYLCKLRNGRRLAFVEASAPGTFIKNDTIYGNQFFYEAQEDKHGRVWVGTSKGLIGFDPTRDAFIHYGHRDDDSTSISSDFIYDLEIDDQNEKIWMAAYNGGLCSYDILSNTFTHFDKDDGLADNTVYAIEKDHHGNFWFSSNAGISAYDLSTKAFRHYSVSDGLLNHEFNRRSSFTNMAGWIFFGGVLGVDYFHPDSISADYVQSSLTFTSFRIGTADYHPSTSSSIPVIDLRPDNRLVTLEFSPLDYSDQQKIQYAYRFDGDSWITIGNQNILSFSQFSAGDHDLYVRSTNSDGVWLDNEIICRIFVHPWWWQTWWFRSALGSLAIAFVVTAMHVYYQRKLASEKAALEKQSAIERERTRIATDMHDDLGANLSRIKFLSETIALKGEKHQPINQEINGIRQYAHEMIDKMGEIVWALNVKNDSLNDLLSYTRAYAVEYLMQNGIQTEVQIDEYSPDRVVSGEFRRNVYLTVKEALHNVVKHAGATRVFISMRLQDQLIISIHDNGTGFTDENIRPFGNGLGNMKKRMHSLGGKLEIKNTVGITVTLTVPLT